MSGGYDRFDIVIHLAKAGYALLGLEKPLGELMGPLRLAGSIIVRIPSARVCGHWFAVRTGFSGRPRNERYCHSDLSFKVPCKPRGSWLSAHAGERGLPIMGPKL